MFKSQLQQRSAAWMQAEGCKNDTEYKRLKNSTPMPEMTQDMATSYMCCQSAELSEALLIACLAFHGHGCHYCSMDAK